MGIALPKWIVESENNIWVLGVYGIIFGVALPSLVVCLLIFPMWEAVLILCLTGQLVVW